MKTEEQNKQDTFFNNDMENKEEKTFDKLLATKKVVEWNARSFAFSSNLSQLPTTIVEKEASNLPNNKKESSSKNAVAKQIAKPSVPVSIDNKKESSSKNTVAKQIAKPSVPVSINNKKIEEPSIKEEEITTATNPITIAATPSFRESKQFSKLHTKQSNAQKENKKNIVTTLKKTIENPNKKEENTTQKKSKALNQELPFAEIPAYRTFRLQFLEEANSQGLLVDFTSEKIRATVQEQTIPKEEVVSDIQEEISEMQLMNESVSSSINGGTGAAQHVSDSPYVEQPTVTGKNLIPRSQEVHDILSYVPSWMVRWGNTVILLILCGILLMSYYIKYPDVVKGVVTINSTYPPVPLMSKATGLITLFKQDKEVVAVDEPIGLIKNTTDYQDVLSLQSVIADFQDKLDENESFSSYKLPRGLQLGELQGAYNQLFLKLKEQKIQQLSNKNNNTRKVNIDKQLNELVAIQKAKEQSLSIKYQEYLKAKNLLDTRYRILYKKGSISAEQLNAKESEVRNLLDIYQNDRMSFNEIKKRKLDLNSSKVELDFQKEDQEILTEASLVAAFEQLKTAIYNWEKTYVLKAPIAGKLNFIRYTKNDMYLQQEQPVANIIPTMKEEGSTMVGELIIPSVGSGKAAIGQEVNVALNDYPKKQYGVILAKVESISNVTVPIPDGNGMVGYKVMISFPNGLENTLKKEIQFKHNMQGEAEIITENIRLIERFFHELRDLVDTK